MLPRHKPKAAYGVMFGGLNFVIALTFMLLKNGAKAKSISYYIKLKDQKWQQ